MELELRDTRTRVEQLEASLAETRERAGDETVLTTALTDLRERVETLARELARVGDLNSAGDLDELHARLAALEGTAAEPPPELLELLELLERTSARVEELERVHAEA